MPDTPQPPKSDWTVQLPDKLPGTVHATAISAHNHALLFCGPSGAGKTTLAFHMLTLGAGLISDDIVALSQDSDQITASHPNPTKAPHAIEARGFSILSADLAPAARVRAVIDLSQISTERLPPKRMIPLGTTEIPVFHKVETSAFPAILMHYLRYGTHDDRT